MRSVSVESRSADIYAEFLHATFFHFLQCECFMRAEVRRGSKEVFMPLSGLQIRGGYCHYQHLQIRGGYFIIIRTANQGVGIVHGGKLEGVHFGEQFSADELKM